ncbi:MAG: adenylate/guanylate cyclase domain-containing protein, partial [Myxococcales bacterium]|nr:adenylate/guanylate cyclase domain-containing protein [Myxococcales bacterium]
MKTANLAIAFTEIAGFNERTGRQSLEQNQRLLSVHSSLLAPLFRAFGGKVIKSIGGSFLVTFESPTRAVLAGTAIQDRLWRHNQAAPEDARLEVRIAINAGEVRLDGSDVFGEPVNIASRVEGVADPGGVYFTEAAHLAMNRAEVQVEEVGAFELRGVPGKVRIFRVPRAPGPDSPPFGNLSRVPEGTLSKLVELGGQLIEKTSGA